MGKSLPVGVVVHNEMLVFAHLPLGIARCLLGSRHLGIEVHRMITDELNLYSECSLSV